MIPQTRHFLAPRGLTRPHCIYSRRPTGHLLCIPCARFACPPVTLSNVRLHARSPPARRLPYDHAPLGQPPRIRLPRLRHRGRQAHDASGGPPRTAHQRRPVHLPQQGRAHAQGQRRAQEGYDPPLRPVPRRVHVPDAVRDHDDVLQQPPRARRVRTRWVDVDTRRLPEAGVGAVLGGVSRASLGTHDSEPKTSVKWRFEGGGHENRFSRRRAFFVGVKCTHFVHPIACFCIIVSSVFNAFASSCFECNRWSPPS